MKINLYDKTVVCCYRTIGVITFVIILGIITLGHPDTHTYSRPAEIVSTESLPGKTVSYTDVMPTVPVIEDYADYHSWSVAMDNYLKDGGVVVPVVDTTFSEEHHYNPDRPSIIETKYVDCWATSWKRCNSGTYSRANHHYSICFDVYSDGRQVPNVAKSTCLDLDKKVFQVCYNAATDTITDVLYCDWTLDTQFDTANANLWIRD